jgi:hypothetical protein
MKDIILLLLLNLIPLPFLGNIHHLKNINRSQKKEEEFGLFRLGNIFNTHFLLSIFKQLVPSAPNQKSTITFKKAINLGSCQKKCSKSMLNSLSRK